MGECMRAGRAQLGAEGLALHLPIDECNGVQSIVTDADTAAAVPLLDAAFADDGTIIVIVPASYLYPAMCRALTVIADVCC
eukprot:5506972-Pyramimonas_sp.AAC.1